MTLKRGQRDANTGAFTGAFIDNFLDVDFGDGLLFGQEKSITWRSFWNGPKGTSGPISEAWRVTSWPTVFVIDSQGKIRFKGVRDKQMGRAITQLLKEIGE